MRDAPWRTLVRDLTAASYESPYLDRLRQRLDTTASHESLEREIVAEMAAALGRAEDKLNAALLRLELAAKALAAADRADERSDAARVFDARRDAALRARWELVVQREAVGIRRNEIVERLYPIPPRPSARSDGQAMHAAAGAASFGTATSPERPGSRCRSTRRRRP
jgi:hypothetical protein